MEINNVTPYETEKKFREEAILGFKKCHDICSHCTSPDIKYQCYHIHCAVFACEKCALRHGHFLESHRKEKPKIITTDKIFWHCNRLNNEFRLVDKGYWEGEIFISNTKICDGCKNIFPTNRLMKCEPQWGIVELLCSGCWKK
jgi:hypothetical protein